ncbi:MAG: CDP-archaeol synthase [Candidatus Buchananbacteria bacterium]
MEALFKAIYFAAPAFFAGISPVILAGLRWFEFLNFPVDFNKSLGGEYIFGNHKTWRGLIFAPIVGIVVAFIQYLFYPSLQIISIVDYPNYWLAFGLLSGLGAIVGDLIKSFFKRRFKIASGKPWPFFDQIDAILGFLIFTYFIAKPDLITIFIIIFLGIACALFSNIIAYSLGIKKVWW